jgi:cation:H+ antiporter
VVNLFLLIVGLGLLVAGAESLIQGGAALARRLGLKPLVIGLTVVAFGTSAPEMVVSVAGSLKGQGDIALGNVVGSNIFNVGVILALAAIIAPVHVRLSLLKLDAPLVVVVSLAAVGLAAFNTIPRWGGGLLLALLIAYTVFSVRLARRQADAEIDREFERGVPSKMRSGWVEVALLLGGLGLLVVGSRLLVNSTIVLARALGAGEAVIGLTIVAAGTSMPELATSVVAAYRGQSDIAVGNVIGSNLFNILGILGLATTLRPLHAPGIGPLDLWMMVVFAVAALPLLWTGRKLQRWEGALLLGGYAAYLWARWPS